MKRIITLNALLLVLVLLSTVGCQSHPRVQYAQAQDTYIAATEVLISARVADLISDEEWQEEVLPLLSLGDTLLDEYEARTAAGLPVESVAGELRRLLQKLRPFVVRAQQQEDQ